MEYTELSDEECSLLVNHLFQSLPDLLRQLAPDGFAKSGLVHYYHPTPEARYREYRQSQLMLFRLNRLSKTKQEIKPTQTFAEFVRGLTEDEVDEKFEPVSLYGRCLWDVFSNNHTVHTNNNEECRLGSFRGSAGCIADVINQLNLVPNQSFHYMDFYMGGSGFNQRLNLVPVYAFIFQKLKEKELDWEYAFPHLRLFSLPKKENTADEPATYNPSAAMQNEIEEMKAKEEAESMQAKFDDIYAKEWEEARYKKPEQTVQAYYEVYGQWPDGHPLNEG